MFICKDCIRQHKRLKVLCEHEIVPWNDLKEEQPKSIVKKSVSNICPDIKELLIIFCCNCEIHTCLHCATKYHNNHNFKFCKITTFKTKSLLVDEVQPLKMQREVCKALDAIQKSKQDIMERQESVANDIQASFKELHNILNNQEQELLTQAVRIGQQKINILITQEKSLSVASTEVHSDVDHTEQCESGCTDNVEDMSMHTEIRNLLEQKIDKHGKSGRSLEPEEEADIGVEVKCSEALQQLCQTQANIIQLHVDPTKCTVANDKKNEVKRLSTAILIIRFSNGKISRRHYEVSCYLKSLHSNVSTQCKANPTGPSGQYSIQYTPTIRGRHELTVSVDRQQVAGSPFPVFVSIHPSQLDKPVKVWSDIENPFGVTVNSEGDILICGGGKIIKLDNDGSRRTLVKQNKLKKLWKIEADDTNIYSIDVDSNQILKCNHDGSNVHIVHVQPMNKGLRGLALTREEVLISECNNKGTVMVYDKELKYVRHIEHQHFMGQIQAITVDCLGNQYCADIDNCRIHVFSKDGVFLRLFGCDGEGKKKVIIPCDLCVFGPYLYVCNAGSRDISVFTTDGVFVTSFHLHGNSEGVLNIPYSICVDKDGFVYVTDVFNGRVQCY